MILDPRANLEAIKADLRSRLPLTTEQQKQFVELLPLAQSVATNLLRRWARHRWLDRDDLRQQAAVYLADAIREFDPSRSPCIRGWCAKFVRWKLSTWLCGERRAHDYKSLAPRSERAKILTDTDSMTAGRWDHYGCYYERPSRRLEIAEVASAVRHCFDPRDVAIFADKESGVAAVDLAYKYGVNKSRIYQVIREVRDYICRKLEDSDLKIGEVVAVLLEKNHEARERALKLFGEKIEKSITLFGGFARL